MDGAKSKQTAFSGEATLELRLSVISTHLTGPVIAVSRYGTATADTILRRFNGSVATLQECFDKLGRYGPRTLSRRSVQMAPI